MPRFPLARSDRRGAAVAELARDRAQPCERRWAPESDANWTSDADEWERLATDAARDAVAKVLKPVLADLEEQLQQVRAERLNRRSESEPEPSNFMARLLGQGVTWTPRSRPSRTPWP
jgi:hypothetical protein